MSKAPHLKIDKVTSTPLIGEADKLGYLVKQNDKSYAELILTGPNTPFLVPVEGTVAIEKRIEELASSSTKFHDSINSVIDEYTSVVLPIRNYYAKGNTTDTVWTPAIDGLSTIDKIVVRNVTDPSRYATLVTPYATTSHLPFKGDLKLEKSGLVGEIDSLPVQLVLHLDMPSIGIPELVFIAGRDFVSQEIKPRDYFVINNIVVAVFDGGGTYTAKVDIDIILYGKKARKTAFLPRNSIASYVSDGVTSDTNVLPTTLASDMPIHGEDYSVGAGAFYIDFYDVALQQNKIYGNFTVTIFAGTMDVITTPGYTGVPTAVFTVPAKAITSYTLGTDVIQLLSSYYPVAGAHTFVLKYNGYVALNETESTINSYALSPYEVNIHEPIIELYATDIRPNLVQNYIDICLAGVTRNGIRSDLLVPGESYGNFYLNVYGDAVGWYEYQGAGWVYPVAISPETLRFDITGTANYLVGKIYADYISQNQYPVVIGGCRYSTDGDLQNFNNVNISSIPTKGTVYWVKRWTSFYNSNWCDVAFGNGIFIAMDTNANQAVISTSGVHWILGGALPVSASWVITYANGLFVALAYGTDICVTSPDGITWAQHLLPTVDYWHAITYGNGLFVATAYDSMIPIASIDGINWVAATTPLTLSLWSVAYGNGVFVACRNGGSGGGACSTSTDGLNWTVRDSASYDSYISVAFGNGVFVMSALGSSICIVSTDGLTWTPHNMPVSGWWETITYANGLFVALANGTDAATSPDGITWTQHTLPTTASWYGLAFGNNAFVAVGSSNLVTTLNFYPNGVTWQLGSFPVADSYRMSFCNGLFIAFNSNKALTSPDGINWTMCTLPASGNWINTAYGNGVFVTIEFGTSTSLVSPDGVTWTAYSTTVGLDWRYVTFGNGLFVAIASGGLCGCITSPDGITWTPRIMPVTNIWAAVTFGNGVFIAVTPGNAIAARSTDGINWTQQTLPISADWINVAYGNGMFVALATNSNIAAVSPDGITWTKSVMPASNSWSDITFGGGVFIAVSTNSTYAATSVDGLDWQRSILPVNAFWWSVAYGNGKAIVSILGTTNIAVSTL